MEAQLVGCALTRVARPGDERGSLETAKKAEVFRRLGMPSLGLLTRDITCTVLRRAQRDSKFVCG